MPYQKVLSGPVFNAQLPSALSSVIAKGTSLVTLTDPLLENTLNIVALSTVLSVPPPSTKNQEASTTVLTAAFSGNVNPSGSEIPTIPGS